MIGVDTNLLVRLFIKDDEIQAQKAKKLIEQQKPVFVSAIVFCETIWILESRYRFTKNDSIKCIEGILKAQHFDVEHRDAMWLALNDFQHVGTGFSDCVIGAVGKIYGCDYVATFDKKAGKSKNFKKI